MSTKFRVGDRVRLTDRVPDRWWFKRGQTGVVSSVSEFRMRYSVNVDGKSTHGPAFVEDFHIELVSRASSPLTGSSFADFIDAGSFIVIERDQFGILSPSEHPRLHRSRLAAIAEAKRLAEKNPNTAYVIFQALTVASAERVVTVKPAVLRDA